MSDTTRPHSGMVGFARIARITVLGPMPPDERASDPGDESVPERRVCLHGPAFVRGAGHDGGEPPIGVVKAGMSMRRD